MLVNNEWMTKATAQADLAKNRFIGYDGNYQTSGGKVKGVLKFDQITGKAATLVYGGTALLELGENITTVDTEIMSGTDGKGMMATVGNYVSAIALSTGNTGDMIEVELTKYKI